MPLSVMWLYVLIGQAPDPRCVLQVEQLQGKVAVLKAASLEGSQHSEELQQHLAAASEELTACRASRAACEERASAAELQHAEASASLAEQLQRVSALESQAAAVALREEQAQGEATELKCRLVAAAEAAAQDKVRDLFLSHVLLCQDLLLTPVSCTAGSFTAGLRSRQECIGSHVCTVDRTAGAARRH